MKTVEILHCLAGSGFVLNVGDVAALDDGEAARLVAAGFAEAAAADPGDPPDPPPKPGSKAKAKKKTPDPPPEG